MTRAGRPGVALPLLATLVAGCGGAHPPGVVPWVDRPLPEYHAPDPRVIRYPTAAPPCTAGHLRVRAGRTGAGLGNYLEEYVFTNVGPRACLLRGRPAVTATASDGTRRMLRVRGGGTYFGTLLPAEMAPGGHVYLDFGTANQICPHGAVYRRLAFRLPQGGIVRAPPRARLYVDCSLDVSDFGLPYRVVPWRAKPGTPGTLRARLLVPTRIRSGAVLRYVVVLRNATKVDVALTPCPGYTEGVYLGDVGPVVRTFALDCDHVHTIAAGRSMRFAMRLALPPSHADKPAKLEWSLDTPAGPGVGAALRIVSSS